MINNYFNFELLKFFQAIKHSKVNQVIAISLNLIKMKNNNLIYGILFTASIFISACSGEEKSNENESVKTVESKEESSTMSNDFNVDLENSQINWKGDMLEMYSHTGIIKFNEANIEMENGNIMGGSFVADLTSITATDENFNPEEGQTKAKLIGHLSSPDFFAVDSFPTASFTIENVEGNSATGTLEIRGNTGTETVKNIVINDSEIRGTMTFNRLNYDVAFKTSAADMVISNDIQLEIVLKSN